MVKLNDRDDIEEYLTAQAIKIFSIREGWWYIGIRGDDGVTSKGTRLPIEKEKLNRPKLATCHF